MQTPNILWIATDQQRYDTIGALGNPAIHTPHLDRLCADGVAFTRAYSQCTVCTPSRASFLTGLYPSTIHVNRNGNAYFPDNAPLITRRLADAGYDCGLVGKLHLAGACRGPEQRADDGYRVFKYSHAPYTPYTQGNQYNEWLLEQGVNLDDIFETNAKGVYYGYKPDIPPELHQTTWCADQAIRFITEQAHAPWLLSVNIFDPHVPFDAPKAYTARYHPDELPRPLFGEQDLALQHQLRDAYHQTRVPRAPDREAQEVIASYYGMVTLIDEQVGRIIAGLEATSQRDNTLIIFTSDHGEMLGDHGLTRKGCRFYEGAVRAPLIIAWPGTFRADARCDELVELTDLVPTLAEVVGLPLGRTHGVSLLHLLRPGASQSPHRAYVRCEDYDSLNSFALADTAAAIKPYYATMYCDGRYKLVVYHGLEIGELYDLEADPHEFANLWDAPSAQAVKYALLKQSFDASIMITDPGPPLVGPY